MGGSLTTNSIKFIKKLYKKKLIDRIETRNIEFFVNKNFLENMDLIIREIFLFELNWIKYKSKKTKNKRLKKDLILRMKEMNKRLKA